MAEWCENPNVPTNLVRVCAHIIICLRIVGLLSNKQKAEEILKCYVKVSSHLNQLLSSAIDTIKIFE